MRSATGGRGFAPRLSLRLRVLSLVALVNALVFGAGFLLLSRELKQRIGGYYAEALFQRLADSVGDGGAVQVASLLATSNWNWFDDALVAHKNIVVDAAGRPSARGALLNPLGADRRPADWDGAGVLRAVAECTRELRPVTAAGGVAVPIYGNDGEVWGGAWFVLRDLQVVQGVGSTLLPWFLGSTLLLTAGTFLLLRRHVLVPVERLAHGAHGIAEGRAGVRVAVPPRDDELAELVRAFNSMAERVEGHRAELVQAVADARDETRRAEAAAMTQRRLAATGELAAGIAHEINNPLGGLLNAIEALETGALPLEKRARYFQLVRSGLERIQATVGKVLRLTPRTGGRAPWNPATPLSDALALVAHRAASQGVELACVHAGGSTTDRDAGAQAWSALPTMHGEPHEVAQAVLNLLVNALDALEGRPRGRIEVRARVDGPDLVLEVVDDGPGVDEAELERVADLFYTTKDPGRGTGLGLAIVHGVAKEHGGRVELWSRPGEGFRATLRLPIAAGGGA